MISAVNAWITKCDMEYKILPLLSFVVANKCWKGESKQKNAKVQSSFKKSETLLSLGDHLPVEQTETERCNSCSSRKMKTRTFTICSNMSDSPYAICFTSYNNCTVTIKYSVLFI